MNAQTYFGRGILEFYEGKLVGRWLEEFIRFGVDLNRRTRDGDPAFFKLFFRFSHSSIDGFIDGLKIIFRNGGEVRLRDRNGKTILHRVCEPGEQNFYSVQPNFVRIIEVIIESGGEINPQDVDGKTPLMVLVNQVNQLKEKGVHLLEGVKLLLENGADPKLTDKQGREALDFIEESEIKELLNQYFAYFLASSYFVSFF